MNYFSLFSGIGGFEYGIEQAILGKTVSSMELQRETKSGEPARPSLLPDNFRPNTTSKRIQQSKCVGFSEIDKYATSIYKKHFPNHKEYGDVTNIKWSNVGDFEMLVGGFPCQSFSIAGKRHGFNDIRGTLFFEIARAAQEKQPRLLLLENVKGLLSHDKGRTFGIILNTLDELGYDLQWQVLNSKNFGVPQNRERIFIIGHLRTSSRPQVFPLRQTNEIYLQDNNREISKCLDSNYHKGWLDHGQRTRIHSRPHGFNKGGLRKNVNVRFSAIQNELVEGIRRLTPTECERLQGFPDGWTEKGIDLKGDKVLISDTQRYKCLGNAVTTNVISAIMEKLLDLPPQKC